MKLIAGPCMLEDEAMVLETAAELKAICGELDIPLIFKGSYDKANRTSISSYRGPGIEEGLRILQKVGGPVTTDVHTVEEARRAAECVDVLQIPAFLCRQTDLVVAAAKTGRTISVKKGQFLAPWDMGPIVEKIRSTGNEDIILIDRGVSFGYNRLISDMRAIPIMQRYGVPVCFDATHSVQEPGGHGGHSGGEREFVPILAKAAVAAGADMIFLEVHPNPSQAKSDADSQLPLADVKSLLVELKQIYEVVQCSAALSL